MNEKSPLEFSSKVNQHYVHGVYIKLISKVDSEGIIIKKYDLYQGSKYIVDIIRKRIKVLVDNILLSAFSVVISWTSAILPKIK